MMKKKLKEQQVRLLVVYQETETLSHVVLANTPQNFLTFYENVWYHYDGIAFDNKGFKMYRLKSVKFLAVELYMYVETTGLISDAP